jgi:hypothetical protein
MIQIAGSFAVWIEQQDPFMAPDQEAARCDGLSVTDALEQTVSTYGVFMLTNYGVRNCTGIRRRLQGSDISHSEWTTSE